MRPVGGAKGVPVSPSPLIRCLVGASLAALLALAAGCAAVREREIKLATLSALDPQKRAAVERVAAYGSERCVTLRPSFMMVGSGAIISPEGWILTAEHVVRGRKRVEVVLANGLTLTGRVVAQNCGNDYALLKIEATGLPFFVLGDRPNLGERVVALGSPARAGAPDASTGVVVYPKVRIPGEDGTYYCDAIFHSAPIFRGDSGGPLINMRSELVGVHGGFASENASVAPAASEIRKRFPAGVEAWGAALVAQLDPEAEPLAWPAEMPRDFEESSAWTIASVEDTLVAVYAPHDRAAVREALERARERYVALRTSDPRGDDELVRAMLSDVFKELEARQKSLAATSAPEAASSRPRRRRCAPHSGRRNRFGYSRLCLVS